MTNKILEMQEKLFKIEEEIEDFYTRLYILENCDLKETTDYQKDLESLKLAIAREQEYLNTLSSGDCWDFLTHLLKNVLPKDDNDDLEAIITREENNKIARRAFSSLNYRLLSDNTNFEEVINRSSNQMAAILQSFGIYDVKVLVPKSRAKTEKTRFIMAHAFNNEMSNYFLKFVQTEMENGKNANFSSDLLKMKYDVPFTNRFIEESMIRNGFDIQNILIVNSELVARNCGLDSFIYRMAKAGYGTDTSKHQISQMLEIKDTDYLDRDKMVSATLRKQLLKASFLFMNDESIADVNFGFHEEVDDNKAYEQTGVSQDMIVTAFKSVNKDRARQKTFFIPNI